MADLLYVVFLVFLVRWLVGVFKSRVIFLRVGRHQALDRTRSTEMQCAGRRARRGTASNSCCSKGRAFSVIETADDRGQPKQAHLGQARRIPALSLCALLIEPANHPGQTRRCDTTLKHPLTNLRVVIPSRGQASPCRRTPGCKRSSCGRVAGVASLRVAARGDHHGRSLPLFR